MGAAVRAMSTVQFAYLVARSRKDSGITPCYMFQFLRVPVS